MSPETTTMDQMRIPRTREEWKDVLTEDLHVPGERVEILATERDGLVRRKELLQAVQDANPEMNGQAKVVAETLATNIEQIDAQRAFITGFDPQTIRTSNEERVMLRQAETEPTETKTPTTDGTALESRERKGNMLTRSAKWLYEKTLVEHPYLTVGSLAVLGLLYLNPIIFNIPAFIERLMAKVPSGKMRQVIESMKKLSPTIHTPEPGVIMAPVNEIGLS